MLHCLRLHIDSRLFRADPTHLVLRIFRWFIWRWWIDWHPDGFFFEVIVLMLLQLLHVPVCEPLLPTGNSVHYFWYVRLKNPFKLFQYLKGWFIKVYFNNLESLEVILTSPGRLTMLRSDPAAGVFLFTNKRWFPAENGYSRPSEASILFFVKCLDIWAKGEDCYIG